MKVTVLIALLLGFVFSCNEQKTPKKDEDVTVISNDGDVDVIVEYTITVRQITNWYDAFHTITITNEDLNLKDIQLPTFNESGTCFILQEADFHEMTITIKSNEHPDVTVCKNTYESATKCGNAQNLFLDIAYSPTGGGWSYKIVPAEAINPNISECYGLGF